MTPRLSARPPSTRPAGKPRTHFRPTAVTLPGLIDDPKNISVNPLAPRGIDGTVPKGSEGVYWLNRNGARLTIGLGQTIHVTKGEAETAAIGAGTGGFETPTDMGNVAPSATTEVTVPADPKEAQEMLAKALPSDRGLVLVPNDPVDPTVFYVGYRPRFTGAPPIPGPSDLGMQIHREQVKQNYDAALKAAHDTIGAPTP